MDKGVKRVKLLRHHTENQFLFVTKGKINKENWNMIVKLQTKFKFSMPNLLKM